MKQIIYLFTLIALLCSFSNDSFAAPGKASVNRHDRQQSSIDKNVWEQYLPENEDNRSVGTHDFDLISPDNGHIEIYAVWYGGQIEQYAKYQFECGIEVDGVKYKLFEGKEDTSTPSSDRSKWSSNPGFAASVMMDPTARFRLYIKYVNDNGQTIYLYSDNGNASHVCTLEYSTKKWEVIGFEDQPESEWSDSNKPDFNEVIFYVQGADTAQPMETKRFFCEIEGSTCDCDYNDIVFDVHPIENNKIEVKVLALGSTFPVELTVAGRVVSEDGEAYLHEIFGSGYKPFNVGGSYTMEPKTFVIDGRIDNLASFTDVIARVTDGNGKQRIVRYNATSSKGEAIIGVPVDSKWMKEGMHIRTGYPKFFSGAWYNEPVDEYLVDLENSDSGGSDIPQSGCVLADGSTFNDRVRALLRGNCAIEFNTGSNNTSSTIVSADDSPVKAYASYDDGAKVLYIYTSAEEFVAPADFSFAFSGMSGLTEIRNIAAVNTDNVTNMYGMFQHCSNLPKLDLSGLNTANVTNMKSTFYSCSSLFSLDLSEFNTANVTDMCHMFAGCSSLFSLDLSNFRTDNVMYMGEMFTDCSALQTIYCLTPESPNDVSAQAFDSFENLSASTLYVTKESFEAYHSHGTWGRFGTITDLTLEKFQTIEKAELDAYINFMTGGASLIPSVTAVVNTYKADIDAATSYADTKSALLAAKAAVDGHNHNQEVVGYGNVDDTKHVAYCSAEGICTGTFKENHSYAEDRSDGEGYYTCICGHIDPVRQHVHSYSEEWSSDGTHHWHECTSTVGTCPAKRIDETEHSYDEDIFIENYYKCNVCGGVDESRKTEYNAAFATKKAEAKSALEAYVAEIFGSTLSDAVVALVDKIKSDIDNATTKPLIESACDNGKKEIEESVAAHTHSYGWVVNETQHSWACRNEDGFCTVVASGYENHSYEVSILDDASYYTCNVCEYENAERKAAFGVRDYLCMTAVGGDVKIGLKYTQYADLLSLQISNDGKKWSEPKEYEADVQELVTLSDGETCYFRRGSNEAISSLNSSRRQVWRFTMDGEGSIEAGGNIMSLLDQTCQATTTGANAFSTLFYNCTNLTKAPKLPATTLGASCYSNLFGACSNLKEVELPMVESFGTDCFSNWLDGAASDDNGKLIVPFDLIENTTISGSLPKNWSMAARIKLNEDPTPGEEGNFYTTFYDSRYDYKVENGFNAYSGSAIDEELRLTATPDNIIPKGDGVLIHGGSGEVLLTVSNGSAERISGNVLTGSDVDITAPANCYILSYGQNRLGFYKYAQGKTLSAHKAYLVYEKPTGAKGLRMVFADDLDDEDGINLPTSTEGEEMIYNLAGQRLNKAQKGINIVGGKKVVIK